MRFIYCPLCGQKLSHRQLGDEVNVPWCDRCDRPFFDMFSACVIVLVVSEDGKVALLKAADRIRAYRTLVSGYIQPGESAEECAIREVQEEIGVTLEQLRLIQTVWFPKREQLMIAFIGHTKEKELHLSCEVEEADWFMAEEAIHLVHPKGPGNASHLLVETYLYEQKEVEAVEREGKDRIDSRCGLHCTGCEYKESCNCGGCIETDGHPFHGECPVAVCCQEKGIVHCGECAEFPCNLLKQYSCDPEHGDTPAGARIEQCKKWAGK